MRHLARPISAATVDHEKPSIVPIAPVQRSRIFSPRQKAILSLILANAIWGTTFVVTKPMLRRVPPVTLAEIRFAIAVAVLVPALLLSGRRPKLNRTTALLGFTGVFIVYVFQNVGLQFTGAANGALIHGGIPVFTALLAAPMIGEALDIGRLGGVALSVAGVTAVVLGGAGNVRGASLIGDLLVLVSAFGLAAYFILGRRAFSSGDPIELVGGVAVFGFLFLSPASLLEMSMTKFARLTAMDWAGLAYLGAAASGLAFLLWAHGLRHLPAAQAATFANLNPVVGLVIAVIALGEPVTVVQLLGGALILGGVWLVVRQPSRRPARREAKEIAVAG